MRKNLCNYTIMNKKHFFYTFATSIFVALVAVFFTSRKDNDEEEAIEITYPEDMSYEPYNIENEEGEFYQNADGTWCFNFDNRSVFLRDLDCIDGSIAIVANMPEHFKNTPSNKVIISGTLQYLYTKLYKQPTYIGGSAWYYKLNISNIKVAEQ